MAIQKRDAEAAGLLDKTISGLIQSFELAHPGSEVMNIKIIRDADGDFESIDMTVAINSEVQGEQK